MSSWLDGIDALVGRVLHESSGLAAGSGSPAEPVGSLDVPPPLTPVTERILLESIETYLGRGRDLLRWWREAGARRRFQRRFEIGRTFDEPEVGFGFFDHADLAGEPVPVMGNFQSMFYDRPKTPAGTSAAGSAAWMRDQMRMFALRYFMRVSDFREPEGFVDTWRPPTSGLFEPLSWCPRSDAAQRGFGFQQLYYKRRDGEIGRFREDERFAVIDLRELGETYEWVVVKVCIFDFDFTAAPFGGDRPKLVLPLAEDSFLVLSRDFIIDETAPAPGLLGRFGFGYAFVKNPVSGLMGYGPGEFDAAIETITFEVAENGTVRVPMVFVANRPDRIVNFRFDPVGWGLRMVDLASLGAFSALLEPMARAVRSIPGATFEIDPVFTYIAVVDRLSGGLTSDALCITRDQLDQEFLVKHYMQHYQSIGGSLAVWRAVADWLDEARLPRWAIEGKRT